MRCELMIESPEFISLDDTNDLIRYMVYVIQQLELEIADMQHAIARLSHPAEAEQPQLYQRYSHIPELMRYPSLGKLLAFNEISIEQFRENIDQHIENLQDVVNGDDVYVGEIL